ncbi:MAG: hypothetical protein R3195_16460 [Gemmatimonadota bacterium]|nr:hypothetical protein [Gemmatimonadota bacterium]
MRKWVKRIRGALGMGLTWAAAWFGAGTATGILFFGGGPLVALFANALLFAVAGFVGGTAFSAVLAIAERSREFHEMSIPRFAGWGALGGAALSVLLLTTGGSGAAVPALTQLLIAGAVTAMGAGSAAGSLAIARKAEQRDALAGGEPVDLIDGA